MTSRTRRAVALVLTLVALAVTASSFLTLGLSAWGLFAPLLAHLTHLLAAFVCGCMLVRLPRVAPREALDLILVALVLGLGTLALLELLAAWLGLVHPATPWVVDAVAFLIGLPRLKPAYERCLNAYRHLDLSIVVASRIPLYAALCAASLVFILPPFLPATPDTNAAQLALPSQAALRADLRGALASRPGEWATPSSALLLHGQLAAGHSGASLFPLTFVVLLGCAAYMHGRRRLGVRAAAWTALALASMPALLVLAACDPASAWLALLVGLAYHEISDWCGKAVGGKIAVASMYGGLAAAESPRGAAAFVALLLFLFLVQVLVDRHGFFKQLPGLAGMVLIALVTAAPFMALALALTTGDPWTALLARWMPAAPHDSVVLVATSAPVSSAAAFLSAAGLHDWARRALEFGPLVLGLVVFVPLVGDPPEGLRHAIVVAALMLLAWIAPAPYGSGLGLMLPVAAAAGAGGTWMLASSGWAARIARLFVSLATPVTLMLSLHSGPDLFAGARLLTGRVSLADYLEETVPDVDLIEATGAFPADTYPQVLLLGDLTDCRYPLPVTRVSPQTGDDQVALAKALRAMKVTHVAIRRLPDGSLPPMGFRPEGLPLVGAYGDNGRCELYRFPSMGWPRTTPEAGAGD